MPPLEDDLRARLDRYPVERYPVQHATTQFHLGAALLHAGETDPALSALTAARQVFATSGMRLEQAKATMMVGVALRAAGRPQDAARALREASSTLTGLDAPTELAAASYDLGLVLQDGGDAVGARAAWQDARELFLAAGYPGQAAAAARDCGASLLADGEPTAALPLLEQAAALAERAGDDAGTAAAANVLGLAHLAVGDARSAVGVLRRALGFVPRTVRADDHAMVKSNLALALAEDGQDARARLAAAQVLAVPAAPLPVRTQARAVLHRLGGPRPDDLLAVLDEVDPAGWPALVREELERAAATSTAEQARLLRSVVDGLLVRPGRSYDLAESVLQVLLELPPRPYASTVAAVVAACADRPEHEVDRVRSVISSALARSAIPQWQRLAASLNDAATASGQPAGWR